MVNSSIITLNSTGITSITSMAYLTGQIFGYFIIPATAVLSSTVSMIYMIVLFKSKLREHTKYQLLSYKVFNFFLIVLIFIGFQNSACQFCLEIAYKSYVSQFYGLYIFRHLYIILAMTELMYSIFFNYERYCVLKNTKTVFLKFSAKYLYLMCLIVFAIARIPDYLAIEIKKSDVNELYYLSKTPLAKKYWYLVYQMIINFGYFFLCIIFISILNILNIIHYNKTMKNKLKMSKNKIEEIKRSQAMFTKMIIISTTITSSAILNILISFVIFQICFANNVVYNLSSYLYYSVCYELLVISYTIDIFLYIKLDKNITKIIKEYLVKLKLIKYKTNTK